MLITLAKHNLLKTSTPLLRTLKRFNHVDAITDNAITNEDPVHKVDLRVGKIVQIDQHTDATHLFIEQVDLNTEDTETMPNPRTIVSGLAPYMSKESLLNKHVIVVANLKPSRFRGVLSQGMLLAAGDDKTVRLLSPPENSTLGERVTLEGVEWVGNVDSVLKPKQKVFEQVAAFLNTNEQGIATYKGIPMMTSKGPVTCEITNAQIS